MRSANTLTARRRTVVKPILFKKQNGICPYCGKRFKGYGSCVIDHLNNNRTDNRLTNLCLAHHACNTKKVTSVEYQEIADFELRQNEEALSKREKEKITDAPIEVQINVTNYDLVKQFLTERINTDGFVPYAEALNSAVFYCKKITDHGSHQSVRNYIASLTSDLGSLMIIKDDSKTKVIVKRQGN